jgi:hypothetical protein
MNKISVINIIKRAIKYYLYFSAIILSLYVIIFISMIIFLKKSNSALNDGKLIGCYGNYMLNEYPERDILFNTLLSFMIKEINNYKFSGNDIIKLCGSPDYIYKMNDIENMLYLKKDGSFLIIELIKDKWHTCSSGNVIDDTKYKKYSSIKTP